MDLGTYVFKLTADYIIKYPFIVAGTKGDLKLHKFLLTLAKLNLIRVPDVYRT